MRYEEDGYTLIELLIIVVVMAWIFILSYSLYRIVKWLVD